MRDMSSIARDFKVPAPSVAAPQDRHAAVAKGFNAFWVELRSIFPAWRQAFATQAEQDAAKKTWMKALAEAGITTPDQLRRGLAVARSKNIPFFPAVGQFVAWCSPAPESYGLPSLEQAYAEATRYGARVSHDAVRLAMLQTSWARSHERAAVYKETFRTAYLKIVARVADGVDISSELPVAIEHRRSTKPVSTEVGRRYCAELLAKLQPRVGGGAS